MEFKRNTANALEWLSDFYIKCGYGGAFSGSDYVYYVLDNKNVVGVVRIAQEYGIYVLRGMQVLPTMRGKQFGSKLLAYLDSQIEPSSLPIFCLPHDHLSSFYARIGFKPVPCSCAPDFLIERIQNYSKCKFKITLLMLN